MANVIISKPPPEPPFQNNSEIWMQGPEPYATKVVDVTGELKLVQNLALDQWYDFYARAPSNATGDAGVAAITINIPSPAFPQPNNPEPYHIWVAAPNQGPTRNTAGVEGISAGNIPAGQTQYIGSFLFTSPTNTAQPPNPVPGGGGGGGGGGFPWPNIPWPDLSFMTTEMWLIAGAGVVGLVVLAAAMGGGGGD